VVATDPSRCEFQKRSDAVDVDDSTDVYAESDRYRTKWAADTSAAA